MKNHGEKNETSNLWTFFFSYLFAFLRRKVVAPAVYDL